MPDNFSLILKNGSCFINGKVQKADIGILNKKIVKIGDLDKDK